MKIAWDYDKKQYSKENAQFELPPEGKYQVRLHRVDYQVSKKGSDMHVLYMDSIDGKFKFRYYLVIDPEHAGMTNQNLGRIYDCFKIPENAQDDDQDWINRWGGIEVEHETFINKSGKEQTTARVKYLLTQEEQAELGYAESLDSVLDISGEQDANIPF